MAQAILTKVTKNENGEIILTFIDHNKEEHTGKYTNAVLTVEQLQELVGTQIAFTGKENDVDTITKAWELDENRPVYSNETYAGDDRSER